MWQCEKSCKELSSLSYDANRMGLSEGDSSFGSKVEKISATDYFAERAGALPTEILVKIFSSLDEEDRISFSLLNKRTYQAFTYASKKAIEKNNFFRTRGFTKENYKINPEEWTPFLEFEGVDGDSQGDDPTFPYSFGKALSNLLYKLPLRFEKIHEDSALYSKANQAYLRLKNKKDDITNSSILCIPELGGSGDIIQKEIINGGKNAVIAMEDNTIRIVGKDSNGTLVVKYTFPLVSEKHRNSSKEAVIKNGEWVLQCDNPLSLKYKDLKHGESVLRFNKPVALMHSSEKDPSVRCERDLCNVSWRISGGKAEVFTYEKDGALKNEQLIERINVSKQDDNKFTIVDGDVVYICIYDDSSYLLKYKSNAFDHIVTSAALGMDDFLMVSHAGAGKLRTEPLVVYDLSNRDYRENGSGIGRRGYKHEIHGPYAVTSVQAYKLEANRSEEKNAQIARVLGEIPRGREGHAIDGWHMLADGEHVLVEEALFSGGDVGMLNINDLQSLTLTARSWEKRPGEPALKKRPGLSYQIDRDDASMLHPVIVAIKEHNSSDDNSTRINYFKIVPDTSNEAVNL